MESVKTADPALLVCIKKRFGVGVGGLNASYHHNLFSVC